MEIFGDSSGSFEPVACIGFLHEQFKISRFEIHIEHLLRYMYRLCALVFRKVAAKPSESYYHGYHGNKQYPEIYRIE